MEAQKNDDRDAERRRRRSVYFRQSKLFVASVAGKLTECCARVDISTETVAIKDIEFDWGLDIEEVNALTRGKHFAIHRALLSAMTVCLPASTATRQAIEVNSALPLQSGH